MATPVRPYAKTGWHSISSQVTEPQSFDQMVWPHEWGCVGLGRSHGRRGQDKRVLDLFIKDSHHRNITVLYLTQDLFPLANSPRQIIAMPITLWPSKTHGIKRAYGPFYCKPFPTVGVKSCALFKRVTSRPFEYLMLDVLLRMIATDCGVI